MTNAAQWSRSSPFVSPRDAVAALRDRVNPHNYWRIMIWTAFPLFFLVLTAFSSPSLAQTLPESDSTLAAIKNLFDNGSYISAELQARRVLEDKHVSDSTRVQLEKYLGFALVAQGKNESAEEHFINALRLDSSLTLDPVLTSPKILTVFESAKEKYRLDLARAESQSGGHPQSSAGLSRGPSFRAILFPGWEQVYQGRKTKGYILLGAGAATAVAAIASDFLRRDARTNYLNATTPALAESRYNTYNTYYKTEIYSVSAFVLIYVYSELDAFLSLPPNLDATYSPYTRSLNLGFHLEF